MDVQLPSARGVYVPLLLFSISPWLWLWKVPVDTVYAPHGWLLCVCGKWHVVVVPFWVYLLAILGVTNLLSCWHTLLCWCSHAYTHYQEWQDALSVHLNTHMWWYYSHSIGQCVVRSAMVYQLSVKCEVPPVHTHTTRPTSVLLCSLHYMCTTQLPYTRTHAQTHTHITHTHTRMCVSIRSGQWRPSCEQMVTILALLEQLN